MAVDDGIAAVNGSMAEMPEAGVLDADVIARLRAMRREGKPSVLGRLIDVYMDTSPRLLQELRSALNEEDAALVELNAHSLKSSSAALGAMEFSGLCREVEEGCRAGKMHGLDQTVHNMEAQFPGVCAALQRAREHE